VQLKWDIYYSLLGIFEKVSGKIFLIMDNATTDYNQA